MELSFCKLRTKDVVNICDGKNLGNITDLIFDSCCGRILGIVVPCNKGFFNIFKTNNDIFIPYNRICKIGKDIILVDIIMQQNNDCNCDTSICSMNNQQQQSTPKLNISDILSNQDFNNEK